MNAIFNAVSMEEFKRISNVEVAHTDKPREKVCQSSNNSMGPQCFGC